jgi:hypothetical protein
VVFTGILRNTKTMQTWIPSIKEPGKNNMCGWLPSPNDLPHNVQHLPPFPPSQSFFLMSIPLQPPFSLYRMLKTPACKRTVPLPPPSVTLMAKDPLSSPLPNKGLLLVEVADCFSVSLTLSSSFSFHLVWKPGRDFPAGGTPFLGYHDSMGILIWSMVHPHGVSNLGPIWMH